MMREWTTRILLAMATLMNCIRMPGPYPTVTTNSTGCVVRMAQKDSKASMTRKQRGLYKTMKNTGAQWFF